MSHLADLALVTPPTTPSTTPTATRMPIWGDVPRAAHINRFRIFTQTRVLARHTTAHVYAISARGFQRELPPTRETRPALRHRRHSVDVVTAGGWPSDAEDVAVSCVPVAFEPVRVQFRETDEPIQREPAALFPDARRYRTLDREESHYFPSIDDPHGQDTYLELPRSSLNNIDFRTIVELRYPDCWFADSVLDVALEMVSLEHEAESHETCIANSLTGQCLFFPGCEGDVDGDDFAGMDEYKKMFGNKKWIFIPINDGMVEKDAASTQGAHWSFIAVNRRDKVAHYIDSLFSGDWRYQRLAHTIATGLGNILGERYDFKVEYHAPHQWEDNKYDESLGQDMGPCGPFVVTMIEEYVKEIVRRRNRGIENAMALNIRSGYGKMFRNIFDSLEVRIKIAKSMALLKVKLDADRFANQHDAVVLAGLEHSVEIVDDQQPLFDGLEEEGFESDDESAVSDTREEELDSDDLEDVWSDVIVQDPHARADYNPHRRDTLPSRAYDPVRDDVAPHEEYGPKQDGVVHRSGSAHRLRRMSGVQLGSECMMISADEPAVEIKLSPTESLGVTTNLSEQDPEH